MTSIFEQKKNSLFVGRAAAGIWLILSERFQNRDIILPANICYAAVFPVIFSGNRPVFCDVDRDSQNMTFSSFRKAITPDTACVIIPHMYGNPCAEIEMITSYCRKNGLLVIEDCASAMGAEIHGKPTGSFGDYVLYSTGYSKTVDLGNGGLILSDFDLTAEAEKNSRLPMYSPATEKANQEFSKAYRQFRNSGNDMRCEPFCSILNSDLRAQFLYRLPDQFSETALTVLSTLDAVIAERRERYQLYCSLLYGTENFLKPYPFLPGAVPWRFVFFTPYEMHKPVIDYLLMRAVPISDWYPVVTPLFHDHSHYPAAETAEQRILNLPLLLPETEIVRICAELKALATTLSAQT